MDEELTARKVFKEQIRRELLAEIKQYLIGVIVKGEMITRKNTDTSNGRLFIIPDDKYERLFEGNL